MSDRRSATADPSSSIPGTTAQGSSDSRAAFGVEDERLRALARTIEAEIVPRLLMSFARSSRPNDASNRDRGLPEPGDLDELARLLLAHEAEVASAFVQIVRQRGTSAERICLDLLAPVAKRLGTLWESGLCDFHELTRGLERLQAILHDVSKKH
jgi:hypothetical protein